MIKRLFFDGVDVSGHQLAVNEGIKCTVTVFANTAKTSFPLFNMAEMGAKSALYAGIRVFVVKDGF